MDAALLRASELAGRLLRSAQLDGSQHDVVELKNTFSGYVLEIETKVFGDSGDIAVRQYSSHCVARDDNAPRKFSIEEVSG